MPDGWKQERPVWCPHPDCLFKRRIMDAACGGQLLIPVEHDGDHNTHRICLRGLLPDNGVLDMQVNSSDLDWLRWIYDALDGKKTSWLSISHTLGTREGKEP